MSLRLTHGTSRIVGASSLAIANFNARISAQSVSNEPGVCSDLLTPGSSHPDSSL